MGDWKPDAGLESVRLTILLTPVQHESGTNRRSKTKIAAPTGATFEFGSLSVRNTMRPHEGIRLLIRRHYLSSPVEKADRHPAPQ